MKFSFLLFIAVVAQPDLRGRRLQPELTYSPETPFHDNVPAPVFGAGHKRSQFSPSYWGRKEPQRYQSAWETARPFGIFERGAGRGFEEEDGHGSRASFGRDNRPAKVVGVNIQMIAGMHPNGHFSPLSGPYEDDRWGRHEGHFFPRSRESPYRQDQIESDHESGSPRQKSFFGPKPTSTERKNEHYEPDLRRQEFDDKEERRLEEFERKLPEHQPDEDIDERFRHSDKNGRFYMGTKWPNNSKDIEQEDMKFEHFHNKKGNESQHGNRSNHVSRENSNDYGVKEKANTTAVNHLVDGETGIKNAIDSRAILLEESLPETTTPRASTLVTSTVHE